MFRTTHSRSHTFASQSPYKGDPRGATWNKWDLHCHTPASVEQYYGDSQQEKTWDDYLAALAALPREIKALGINDYFTIDGYKRVREAHRAGKLPNIDLVLPIVELRLSAFAGSSVLQKVNFHVLFSDELDPNDIDNFFLRNLNVDLQLDQDVRWSGCLGTAEGLEELGRAVRAVTPEDKRTTDSDTRVGFRSAAIPLEKLTELLNQTKFDGRTLTALGLSEWDQMRWDGSGAAQKRDVMGRVHFVLTSSPTADKYHERRRQLVDSQVNARLFDASDAHYYSDSSQPNRLGQCRCWIKSDVTFAGLRRAIGRFDDRVFVGDIPPKLALVKGRPTKYIRRVDISKKSDSTLNEMWFDSHIELNPGLVAIIGNQGSGKSALTDAIALCGGSTAQGFSFLTPQRFRDKDGKASSFESTLTWYDGTPKVVSLDAASDPDSVERVRYVPQGFFDRVTNETAVTDSGDFYAEIKKAVFSHVAPADRLGSTTFDELVARRTAGVDATLTQLRGELAAVNKQIVELEAVSSPTAVQRLTSKIGQRKAESVALRNNPPASVSAPDAEQSLTDELDQVREREATTRAMVTAATAETTQWKRRRLALVDAKDALVLSRRQFEGAVEKVEQQLTNAEVNVDVAAWVSVAVDLAPLERLIDACDKALFENQLQLDPAQHDSLAAQLTSVAAERVAIEKSQETVAGEFNGYLKAKDAWQVALDEIEGSTDSPSVESIAGLGERLRHLTESVPSTIRQLENKRRELCRDIHRAIGQLTAVYADLTRPVQQHIADEPLVRDRYPLSFEVAICQLGLPDKLFTYITRNAGTFSGGEKGIERLTSFIDDADFLSPDGAATFADNLLDRVRRNHKSDPPIAVDWPTALRKGVDPEELYDLIYSLEYLTPAFSLSLNGKALRLLSPGERGILLLVFYLVVDCGDEPLIIDQPEGNLNNQSIVEHLVPVFMAAKERRQVIVVTHNPNLAVVCDAEQVVHCQMRTDGTCAIEYDSGAIENPKFNRLSLDLLEGTAHAFISREDTYRESATLYRTGRESS